METRWIPALVAISLVGMAAAPPGHATETTDLADEKALVDELCAYRDVL